MYVSWEAPAQVTGSHPIILVHGGAVQGTEWLGTPDGRPGWAQRLVDVGYAVFTVDRPTQGRSPWHPDVDGPIGPPFSYEEARAVFFPEAVRSKHTQWPIDAGDESVLDTTPGIGTLSWGLTAAPITYDPPRATAEEARAADPSMLRIPALRGLPVAVVAGETSPQAGYAPDMVRFLRTAGAAADLIHLPELGIYGNGPGLIYEKNSDEALQPVLRWLAALPDRTAGGQQHPPAVRPAQ